MKILLSVLCLGLFIGSLSSYPVRIQSWDLERDVKTLNSINVNIDTVNLANNTIIAYVASEEEQDKIAALGIVSTQIVDEAREYFEYLVATTRDSSNPMNEYYSIDEYHSFMQTTASQYPNICQLIQYGTSVQGRPIYAMKISDNVTANEFEPELKLVASIHPDETVGYDLMIRLIQLLTSSYGSNTRISDIVNNTELWIAPLINPDGYVLGQRTNANGIDLNRNFPMPNGVQNPDGNAWASETIAMMNFSNSHNFIMGLTFHGGALVINYPWDYTYTLAPDDALLRHMSLAYSIHNTPMYNSSEFTQGITNGAAWYVANGTLQDWNYGLTSCIDLTAEVSNIKWPPASTLDTYWAQNQESILSYIELSQVGVKGIVSSQSGTPLPASITIINNTRTIRNDPQIGDYHRLLLPGNYTISVSSEGYIPQSRSIIIPSIGFVTENFSLEPAMMIQISGQVRRANGTPIPNASVSLLSNPPVTVVTDNSGLFIMPQLFEGDYQIQIHSTGFASYSRYYQFRNNQGRHIFVMGEPLFSENFDNGITLWTATSPWAIINQNGNNVLTDSPSGNYSNNINRSIRLSSPINLQGITNPILSFKAKWDLEIDYDFVYIEGSTTGTTWTQIGYITGDQPDWRVMMYSLQSWSGGNFFLRFRIRTDQSQTADGIYIDEVTISGIGEDSIVYGDVDQNGIVNNIDAKTITNYSVGMSEVPWSANMIQAANVDNDDEVSAMDAYLLLKYINEPTYRLPIQTGDAFALQPSSLSASINETVNFTISDPSALKALQINFQDSFQISNVNAGSFEANPNNCLAINPIGAIALVAYSSMPNIVRIGLQNTPLSIDCVIRNNGVSSFLTISGSDSNEQTISAPRFYLMPNTPNPFNPNTAICFSLAESGQTKIEIYNAKGQRVRTLFNSEFAAGLHRVTWDGTDDLQNSVSSGIYLYRLTNNQQTQTRKMVLTK